MYPRHLRRTTDCIALVVGALLLPISAIAADAHTAVKAKPGDIVVLRNVSARPAYRPAPPGMALMVDPSPRNEINHALGTGELSDADYASLDASPTPGSSHRTVVEQMVGNTLVGTLGDNSGSRGVARNGAGNVISGPLGAVGNTTRGIGSQILGAMSQLPTMTPAATAGR